MRTGFSTWYARVYPKLSGGGIWLRGHELNTLPESEFEKRPFRVLIARLSTYRDTAESFTHPLLYRMVREDAQVYPDLAFLPPAKDAEVFDAHGVPWLLGTTSKRGPRAFNVIAFSNSIVQELINLPAMLTHSGLPLRKSERMNDPAVPLLILGGANALYSSVLWTPDPMVDGVFVGEGEANIAALFRICREGAAAGGSKRGILEQLEAVPGFVLPDRPRPTATGHDRRPMATLAVAGDLPVSFVDGAAGRAHLPISEGCPCFCSFCAESFGRKPYRENEAVTVLAAARRMKAAQGLDDVDVYSFNFNMHSEFYRILWDLVPLFDSIGLKSQRLDFIAQDPELLGYLNAVGKSSLTVGIEGLSGRMRRYLHKNLSDADLSRGLRAIARAPLRELKLFFIATGLETAADFSELKQTLGTLMQEASSARARPRVMVSVTPLVRFPATPLERADAPTMERMSAVLREFGAVARAAGCEFRAAAEVSEYWLSQVLVRASDPRVAQALVAAQAETGFIYYEGIPASVVSVLRRHLGSLGLDPDAALKGASEAEALAKPWAVVESGVSREFLNRQFELSQAFEEHDYCLGRFGKSGSCQACGACDTPDETGDLTGARQPKGYTVEAFRARLAECRADGVEVALVVTVGELARGLDRKCVGVAVARALMLAEPELVSAYRTYRGLRWADEPSGRWVTGDDVITLVWRKAGVPRLLALLASPSGLGTVNASMGRWGEVKDVARASEGEVVLVVTSPFAFDGQSYLLAKGLRYTYRKESEGLYRFEFTPDSVKKRFITAMTLCREASGGCSLTLTPGLRFDPAEFAKSAFLLPEPGEWIRIHFCAAPSVAAGSDARVTPGG